MRKAQLRYRAIRYFLLLGVLGEDAAQGVGGEQVADQHIPGLAQLQDHPVEGLLLPVGPVHFQHQGKTPLCLLGGLVLVAPQGDGGRRQLSGGDGETGGCRCQHAAISGEQGHLQLALAHGADVGDGPGAGLRVLVHFVQEAAPVQAVPLAAFSLRHPGDEVGVAGAEGRFAGGHGGDLRPLGRQVRRGELDADGGQGFVVVHHHNADIFGVAHGVAGGAAQALLQLEGDLTVLLVNLVVLGWQGAAAWLTVARLLAKFSWRQDAIMVRISLCRYWVRWFQSAGGGEGGRTHRPPAPWWVWSGWSPPGPGRGLGLMDGIVPWVEGCGLPAGGCSPVG